MQSSMHIRLPEINLQTQNCQHLASFNTQIHLTFFLVKLLKGVDSLTFTKYLQCRFFRFTLPEASFTREGNENVFSHT